MHKYLVVRNISIVLVLGAVLSGATGCTGAEESQVITQLQTGLSSLLQNRALTEQFVRDIKTNVDPSDPGYAQAMDSYQDAREAYDHFLDTVEGGSDAHSPRSLRGVAANDVQNSTADFLADATSVLKPTVNTRRIPFQRAVVIPDNLQTTLNKLPRKAREKVIDQFDRQVRWRSWSQL
jgi:ABC-type transporter Mla subunit MlaD